MESIKNALKDKTFKIYFAICFLLATPIFIKIGLEDFEAGKMTLLHGTVMTLQYLFCVSSLPSFFSKQRSS
jgi:uncharacterized membrane protein